MRVPKFVFLVVAAAVSGSLLTAAPALAGTSRLPGAQLRPASAPSGYSIRGIDVSDNNDPINWATVANSGVDFAIVKATEGTSYTNENYASDISGARSHGLYVGAYGYARPDSNNPAAQADRLAAVANYQNDGRTLRPFVDLEFGSTVGQPNCYGLSPSQLVSWISTYLTELTAKVGVLPMIYTAAGWWDPCTGSSTKFGKYPLDVANYDVSKPNLPSGWSTFTLWQYTDDSGTPGAAGAVDGDVFNGSATDLQDYLSAGSATFGSAFVRTSTQWHGALTGSDTHAHQLVYEAGQHWIDQDLGGGVVGNLAMVYNAGRYDIFALGPSGQLYQDIYRGSGWEGWHAAGDAVFAKGAGVTAIYAGGVYRIFGRGPSGAVFQVFYSDGAWHSQNLGGSIVGTPGAVYANGRYDLFALGPSGALFQDTDSGSGWAGWHQTSDAVFKTGTDAGVTALYAQGAYRVFGTSPGGALFQFFYTDGWHSQNLGGSIVGTPAVTYLDGRYDVFARSSSGNVFQDTYAGSGWSGFTKIYDAV